MPLSNHRRSCCHRSHHVHRTPVARTFGCVVRTTARCNARYGDPSHSRRERRGRCRTAIRCALASHLSRVKTKLVIERGKLAGIQKGVFMNQVQWYLLAIAALLALVITGCSNDGGPANSTSGTQRANRGEHDHDGEHGREGRGEHPRRSRDFGVTCS